MKASKLFHLLPSCPLRLKVGNKSNNKVAVKQIFMTFCAIIRIANQTSIVQLNESDAFPMKHKKSERDLVRIHSLSCLFVCVHQTNHFPNSSQLIAGENINYR